jgi:hypothetical protein
MNKRKKPPVKPYYAIKHEHADSLQQFEEASMMLFNTVTAVLEASELVTDPKARTLLETLRTQAEKYRKRVYE